MRAIFKREFKSYFQRTSGFLFLGLSLFFMSVLVVIYSVFYGIPSMAYALSDMTLLTALIVPAFFASVISGERKRGTDKLLSMLPITRREIVLGKYFAALMLFALSVLSFATLPVFLSAFGSIDLAASYASLFCYAAFGVALISISLFISSLFDNTWVSLGVNYGAVILLYLANSLSESLLPMGKVKDILLAFSFFGRFDSFMFGLVDPLTIVYYILVAEIFLSLSLFSAEKRRLF